MVDVFTQLIRKFMNALTKHPARAALLLLGLFFVASIFLIFEYAHKERSRDLMDWQLRLSVLADMRAAEIEEWNDDRESKLSELANNITLKLYLTQYHQNKINNITLKAQFSHVRNLLQATSLRYGFVNDKSNSVNTAKNNNYMQGLAVLSEAGEIVFSTRGFYKDSEKYKNELIETLDKGRSVMIDIFKVDRNKELYGFLKPVFSVHNAPNKKPVGAVIVLMDPQTNLYKRLENNYSNTKTDESNLLRKYASSYEYISPLRGGLSVFHKASDQMASELVDQNSIINITKDYRNKDVLRVHRRIDSTPWMLTQKIDVNEALAESDDHQKYLISTFILISLFLVSLFIAVWRHSTSVKLSKLTIDLETRTALLNAVSENINEHIFLVDEANRFVFANQSLANSIKVDAQDVYGKKMASVLGADVEKTLLSLSCETKHSDSECVVSLSLGEEENIYHVSSVVLQKGEYKEDNLFVLHDITSIKKAQEKRDQLSKGIISTLVKAVDLHDPYCTEHSERTREVAVDIAHELGLEQQRCETLEMAALLANIGKLFVPKEILIKMDALTEEESRLLKDNIHYAADILKELAFEGPVVDIILQKNENLDGSGYPVGLREENILLEARILAVSNAFVAMASSRAYRQGKSIKEVVNIILEQADDQYDRHVVAALFHIAENKSDWNKWKNVSV